MEKQILEKLDLIISELRYMNKRADNLRQEAMKNPQEIAEELRQTLGPSLQNMFKSMPQRGV